MLLRQAGAAMLAAIILGLAPSAGAQPAGPFTADQAVHGRQVYFQNCATCHGEDLQGKVGPALTGRQFHQMIAAQNMNAAALFQFMSHQMPQSKPGSLGEETYIDVFAYIVQQNGFVPGTQKLTAQPAELEKINLANLSKSTN